MHNKGTLFFQGLSDINKLQVKKMLLQNHFQLILSLPKHMRKTCPWISKMHRLRTKNVIILGSLTVIWKRENINPIAWWL